MAPFQDLIRLNFNILFAQDSLSFLFILHHWHILFIFAMTMIPNFTFRPD